MPFREQADRTICAQEKGSLRFVHNTLRMIVCYTRDAMTKTLRAKAKTKLLVELSHTLEKVDHDDEPVQKGGGRVR